MAYFNITAKPTETKKVEVKKDVKAPVKVESKPVAKVVAAPVVKAVKKPTDAQRLARLEVKVKSLEAKAAKKK